MNRGSLRGPARLLAEVLAADGGRIASAFGVQVEVFQIATEVAEHIPARTGGYTKSADVFGGAQ